MKHSNHDSELVPCTTFGSSILEFDFPSLEIGVATYKEGPTGCTVFHFPKRARMMADVRGGSPGVLLVGQWETLVDPLHAICFTGGSIYGLESVTGIYSELHKRLDYDTAWYNLACVSAAVIYDFRPRDNAIYPDKALGTAALRAAQTGRFPMGPIGAGASASVGKISKTGGYEIAGQGGAFCQIGEVKVAVFTVVNAIGAIVDRTGKVVRGNLNKSTGQRFTLADEIMGGKSTEHLATPVGGNTTLTILVTNLKLDPPYLQQVARQVHSSMARAIQPFHTSSDGDVFFAVSTEEVKSDDLNEVSLGVVGAELAWDAVLNCY